MSHRVFAIAQVSDKDARRLVYDEIKQGKSRFGMWNQKVSLTEEHHGRNAMFSTIRPGDWIVHVNCPEYGRCVAVRASGPYGFDNGVNSSWGKDFCNYILVDVSTMIEFDGRDPNVQSSVNLRPLRRIQRIHQVDDFHRSLDNLRSDKYRDDASLLRSIPHMREKMNDEVLTVISSFINQQNRGKEFERFLCEVFNRIPGAECTENGFGWGTDHGADLIVELKSPIEGLNLSTRLVVQAKSYEGKHYDLNAIDQLVNGIKTYDAQGGVLITTAESTEKLEDYARKMSEDHSTSIDIIAGAEVARFVMRYAPELLLG